MRDTLLIIEDEELLGGELARHFRDERWRVERATSLAEAREVLAGAADPLVVLSDMNLGDGSALDLLEEHRDQRSEWILLTGFGTVPDSVRALRLGAFDFLEKPCPLDRLDLVVAGAARSARAQRRLRDETERRNRTYSPDVFLGESRQAGEVRAMLRRLVELPIATLLIEGETGTGKGLAARILHYGGQRADGPLVEVNCAALPRELMESELFGHEAGAFTGARGRHRGLFEQAQGGTLFLDEVGELDPALQAKLLKAVEDRRVRRLGAERETDVDVQLFAASNRPLSRLVREGGFREDLFHRLGVLQLELPPLRVRISDLEQLVPALLAEFNARSGAHVTVVPDPVWRRLQAYAWPGNVRELRNVLERSVLLSKGDTLDDRWLGLPGPSETAPVGPGVDAIRVPIDGSLGLDEIEAMLIRQALEHSARNVSAAARLLGVSRQTLRYRIEKHGIQTGEEERASGGD